eukprot:11343397-Ditylum_brightwellii.AAC.1
MIDEKGQRAQILALLDTSAIGKVHTFVKQSTIKNIPIPLRNVKAISKTVEIKAYVENNAKGCHNLVLGIKYCSMLGLNFDFEAKLVTWDDVLLPMKKHGNIKPSNLNLSSLNPTEQTLLLFATKPLLHKTV